jgi:dienelactone hydrolase
MRPLQPFDCEHDGTLLRAQVAVPDGKGPFPAVLVMHSALGLRGHVFDATSELADAGYLAIATDMYGADADISDELKAGEHYMALLEAPDRLRARCVRWFEAVAARPHVDASRMAAIGYCFGGYCVLELARSGVDAKAIVSYHGLLKTHAPAEPGVIKGEVVAYCARHDPYAPMEEVAGLRQELEHAGVHYQITVFGEAAHGFTDPNAGASGREGISYHAQSHRISWAGTLALLDCVLRR